MIHRPEEALEDFTTFTERLVEVALQCHLRGFYGGDLGIAIGAERLPLARLLRVDRDVLPRGVD